MKAWFLLLPATAIAAEAPPSVGTLLKKAAEAAAGIKELRERVSILAFIGQLHHRAGDKAAADRFLKQAHETAAKIEEDTPLYSALLMLTMVEVERGQAAAAVKACELMENANLRAGLLRQVVRLQAEGGDPKGAIKTAEGLKGTAREQALATATLAWARELARKGDGAAALKAAAKLDPWNQYHVRTDIAAAHAKAKEPEKAKAVLADARRQWEKRMEKVIPPSTKARFLADHAQLRAESGDVAGAMETFAESKFEEDKGDHGSKGYHYWRLAEAFVKAGEAKAATIFVAGLKDTQDRYATLLTLVRILAEAKEMALARAALAKAKKLDADVPAARKALYASTLAAAEVIAGDVKAALATARAAKKGAERGRALVLLGRAMGRGRAAADVLAEGAAELAAGDASGRIMLQVVAGALAEAGDPARALALLDKEKDPFIKTRCLLAIVNGMNKAAGKEAKKP